MANVKNACLQQLSLPKCMNIFAICVCGGMLMFYYRPDPPTTLSKDASLSRTIKSLAEALNTIQKFTENNITSLKEKVPPAEKLVSTSSMQKVPSPEEVVSSNIPMLYLITPTYYRTVQRADLTRFLYAIKQVQRIHWIVIEDSENKTAKVSRFLKASNVSYTHLAAPSPKNSSNGVGKGVMQRNAGMDWIRQNTKPGEPGVFYFADDDNTYDVKIFELIRYTKLFSVFPVGLAGCRSHEDIKVENNTVVGFIVCFGKGRKYAMDMAGFAMNIKLLHINPTAMFKYSCGHFNLEPCFIDQLHVELKDFEPVAKDQTQILVWHTQTTKHTDKQLEGSDLEI